ncbi:MAG: DUF4230 domain-containing protein [Kiritimatiellae bacterium]|nr:DUF4230 domain-containing protein [Kiritimatiellia bacterium]
MDIKKIGVKNLIGILAIGGGLAYLGISLYMDSRPEWWDMGKSDPCRDIRKANDHIRLLTVSEIVTKDVIYLKQDMNWWQRHVTLGNAGKFFMRNVMLSANMFGQALMMADPEFLKYKMDPGTGVVWGHQCVIEYVVDLSRADVKLKDGISAEQRPCVIVTVPAPSVDPGSVRLNLETFAPILKNKAFQDGDETMVKMERIAKKGFVDGLEKIADTPGYLQDARAAAKTALTAIYTSAAKGAEVEVQFK